MRQIYLDHAATTPLHPSVLAAMLEVLEGPPANPSSVHAFGRRARARVTAARDSLAERLGCRAEQLVFTSGGTESDNLALLGTAAAMRGRGRRHIVTSAIEHHAVLHTCERLEREGFDVTRVQPDAQGIIHAEQVAAALRPDTGLVSVMMVNNELGTIQPIADIGERVRAAGVVMHVDAVQALGKLPLDLRKLPVDLLSLSAHKINGPQGVGVLYVAPRTSLHSQLLGGTQERGRRAGTENVAGIVGMARALELAEAGREAAWQHAQLLQRTLLERLAERDDIEYAINGADAERVPHIVNLRLRGVGTESLLMNLDLEGVAAASGSACSSGSLRTSHVLQAIGMPELGASAAVRVSFGIGNTVEEIEYAADKLATICARIRTTH
ncbi:cysteine desulfurase [Paenibacillus sp. IB182496]|uniref:cysteine desulfurase n=1 Tax=Paenibacillus sabuli TaxID=2772509 RepID=A0A927GR51_9BACL|nr:cysteine desulfurase family protein [Paenibacillus sabuli]MBD2844560.1 cysteine desulfurase [Paenibacillus sabuli]